VGGKMSVLFMSAIRMKVDTGMVAFEAWLLTDFAAPNGYSFVQDGHSYSVAGLAGNR